MSKTKPEKSSRPESATAEAAATTRIRRERWRLLRQINEISERPMIVLSLIWLVLTIIDFVSGLGPFLRAITYVIWGLFVLNFLLEFTIAPHKRSYLKHHWLTAIALLLPALGVFRLVRVLRVLQLTRVARSLNMVRLLTSVNRGTGALRNTIGQSGIGFVITLTVVMVFAGAAGMLQFENPGAVAASGANGSGQAGITSYGEAIWWAAMALATSSAAYAPQTVAGRVLAFLLSFYGLAVFGYITATVASYLVGRDKAAQEEAEQANTNGDLRRELTALRAEVRDLNAELRRRGENGTHGATGNISYAQKNRSADPAG